MGVGTVSLLLSISIYGACKRNPCRTFWVGKMDTEQRFVMSMLVAVDAAKGNKVEQGAEESKKMPLEIWRGPK